MTIYLLCSFVRTHAYMYVCSRAVLWGGGGCTPDPLLCSNLVRRILCPFELYFFGLGVWDSVVWVSLRCLLDLE